MPETPTACERYEEDLSSLIDGELSAQREAELQGHLDACTGCRQRLEALRGVDRALAEVALPEVSAELRTRLQAQIQSIPEREVATRTTPLPPRARRRLTGPALGAALALAASVAIYLAVAPEPTSEPGSEAPLAATTTGLEAASDEELAMALQLEMIQDLDIIANLEMLERLMAVDGGAV